MPQSRLDEYKARQAERERQEKERLPMPWWWLRQREPVARFTAYLAVFTVSLVVVGVLQWLSIRGELNEMKSGERAWVGASDYTYTIAESGPVKGVASVSNVGKTPAMAIVSTMTGRTLDHVLSASDIIYPAKRPTIKQGTVFPNQRFPLTVGGDPMDSATQKTWFENVKAGRLNLYFFGEIRYRDVFGHDHWTHFCTRYVPDTASGTPCPIYNDTDDDQKP
jgi:hypothetical protein